MYDPAWRRARELIAGWFEAAGLETRVDAVGNVWGRLAGREPGPSVVSGSHFDSVPDGGKYDGPLGIVGALSAIEELRAEHGPPRRTREALALAEEESSRFRAGFWASRAILGGITADEPELHRDLAGVTLADAMREAGLDPDRIPGARRDDIAAFVELHIEQGPWLEKNAAEDGPRPVGVVRAITGLARGVVTLTGRADHAGTTPMTMRSDALLGLAEAAPALRQLALDAGHPAVVTIGRVDLTPNATNVVPGRVRFTLDVRHPNEETLGWLVDEAASRCREAAARHGLGCEVEVHRLQRPVHTAPELVEVIRQSVLARGYRPIDMVSGAGHDAQALRALFPTAMLFVVSREGRSHSPLEYSSPEDCLAGVEVLAETLRRLAY